MTLGLLGIMHSPIKQSALCLEEPEKGLHPGRLRWLFDKLIELAYPDHEAIPVQVLISTHSPEFVNLFKNMRDSVSIFESFGGRTRVRRLNEITESLHLDSGNDEPIGSLWATGLYENL
jgi:predicted ATPase